MPTKPAPATAKSKKNKKKGDRSFITIIAIILVVGVGVLGYVMATGSAKSFKWDPSTPLPPAKGYVMGSDSAAVEIIEFADFECPVCGEFALITEPDVRERLVKTGLARFKFVDFPLEGIGHNNNMLAHNAAACADAQGKFWQMHDSIFVGQAEWSAFLRGSGSRNPAKVFKRYARGLGLDQASFEDCLDNHKLEAQVRGNKASGEARGVSGTPNFFVGTRGYPGKAPYDMLKALVDSAAADARAAKTPDPKSKKAGGPQP